MEIVRVEDIDIEAQKNPLRGGQFRFRRLLEGVEGRPDNFIFRMTRLSTDFYSPRHRHNFDQLRVILEGWTDFHRNGKLREGMIGYFPEAAPYGPQSCSDTAVILALQFGGASGHGYISADQTERATAELAAKGKFDKGIYTETMPNGRKRNVDAYRAVWEHVNGRPLVFPKPRYRDPVFMDPANYHWQPTAEPGVSRKNLGSFTECNTALHLTRLEPGASVALEPHGIHFLFAGAGSVGREPCTRHTTIHLARGEAARFKASVETVLYTILLPNLDAFLRDRDATPIRLAS